MAKETLEEHKNTCSELRRQERHMYAQQTQKAISDMDEKIDNAIKDNNDINTNLRITTEKMTNLNTKVDGVDKKVDNLANKLDTIIEKLDSKYASKWVEKFFIFAGSVIGTILISAFMYLIIKQ